jgi:hypothetical protein
MPTAFKSAINAAVPPKRLAFPVSNSAIAFRVVAAQY